MTEDTAADVTAVVEQLSATYFVVFRDRLDVLTCSTLLLGWARSQCYNPDLLAQMAEQIITKNKQGSFFEPGTESEIANMLNGMSGLQYQNEELVDVLQSFLVGPNFKETGELPQNYDLYTTYNIITSLARLNPSKTELLTDFIPHLHRLLQNVTTNDPKMFKSDPYKLFNEVPDITMYVNLWLTMATFAALQPNFHKMTVMPTPFKTISADLIKLFNQNPRWNATELNVSEAANISVAIAVLKVQNEKFIGDVGDIIRANIRETDQYDLINLAKSTNYLRQFKYSRDLYAQVHAESMNKLRRGELEGEVVEALKQIYTDQGVFEDSPFVEART